MSEPKTDKREAPRAIGKAEVEQLQREGKEIRKAVERRAEAMKQLSQAELKLRIR